MTAAAEVVSMPATQNNGLIKVDASERLMTLCSNGESSLKFIQDMGKTLAESRMLKLKNPQQGAAVILASICEGITPFQLMREFHVMDDGGMSMKADVMLAKFNAAGGKHQWLKTGDDGDEATLRLIWAGQDVQVSYSIEDAKRAKLIRAGGNWEKNPGEMLRARATSKGVRMVMPGIVAGIYCPEDFSENEISPAEPQKRTTRSTAKAAAAPTDVVTDDSVNVADAIVEPASTNDDAAAPFDAGDSADDITTILMEIDMLLTEIGKTKADIEAGMKKNNPKFTSIDDLSIDSAKTLLGKLRVAAEKKRASASA